uniref:Uncharacterized protein n=2 Tax=unclassified Caudoviricetes TaxID=2788787 RepID=A0A8S5PNZ3_9CAUD|nr:MAG TPA: hypothetical protein [Siphoviridae sp. ctdoa10]DAE08822.1 MAG TPA: hypothetical protein [Siphoviridae sp. ctAiL5]
MADQESLPRQGALGKGEARRAYGEGKETSLRPIRRASISTTSLHATTATTQPTGKPGQFTPRTTRGHRRRSESLSAPRPGQHTHPPLFGCPRASWWPSWGVRRPSPRPNPLW